MTKLTIRNWISFSIYHDHENYVLTNVVRDIPQDLFNKEINQYMFSRAYDRGKNLFLMFELNTGSDEKKVRAVIQDIVKKYLDQNPSEERKIEYPVNDWFLPFPSNHIEYKENFVFDIMETGGLKASLLAKSLLSSSSKHIVDFISNSEEWNPESAMGVAIQFHLSLGLAFNSNLNELLSFYDYFFDSIIKKTQGSEDNFKQNLISGLSENFDSQKEGLVNYAEYIIEMLKNPDDIEEEWMKQWYYDCKNISDELNLLQKRGEYVVPENFSMDESNSASPEYQRKWPVLEYYLRSINSQLGVTDVYELNLIYSLKEILKELNTVKEEVNG